MKEHVMTDDPQRPRAWLQMDGLEAERLRDRLEGSDDPIPGLKLRH